MGRRKRVTYRPGKSQGIFGVIWGSIFVLIGVFAVIPAAGGFGLLWTGMALFITLQNAYQSFGKKYRGPEIHIEEEETPPPSPAPEGQGPDSPVELDAERRLEQLERLKSAGLITDQEYETKRKEILREL